MIHTVADGGDGTIRILHVDDEPNLAELTAAFLTRENDRFSIETATTANEGLNRLSEEQFDCVISDHDMPGWTGVEFLKAVREEYPDLPFILYTGKGSEEVASDAISAGVTDYLQKDSGTDQYMVLANRVRNAVERYWLEREAEHTQAQLQIIADQNEQVIKRVTDAIVEVDANWRFTLVNEQAEALYEMSAEYLLGRDFWDVFEEAKGTRFEEEYRSVMETREPTSFVEYFSQLDSWFDIKAYPKPDGGIAFYFIDTTEQREREHHLKAEHAFISETLDTLNDIYFVVGMNGELQRWNERVMEVTGCPEAELAEMNVIDVFPENERERISNAIGTTLETGWVQVEAIICTVDDTPALYEFVAQRLTDSRGEVIGITGIGRDISDRKQREARLRALNEKMYHLMTADTRQHISEIGVKAASTIVGLDTNAIHLYDDEQEGLVPVAQTDTAHDLIGDLPTFTEGDSIAWRIYEQGEAFALDDIHDDPDVYNPETSVRSELYLSLGDHGILIAGSELPNTFDQQDLVFGEILASAIAAALDQVEGIEQLQARERELTRQNDQLEAFTSIVSHDLRNPLNVAMGRTELAREECNSSHLDTVSRAHDRMDALIDDLLTLAREGELVGELEPVDLSNLAESCWANVATAETTLVTELTCSVQADRNRLQQLVENLFRNAVEHGGEDATVTVGELENGFYIEDDGPGIPKDERYDVFDAGYTTAEGGTGFGLSIVKRVVNAHNWKVRVNDGFDGGTRFEITGVEFAAK